MFILVLLLVFSVNICGETLSNNVTDNLEDQNHSILSREITSQDANITNSPLVSSSISYPTINLPNVTQNKFLSSNILPPITTPISILSKNKPISRIPIETPFSEITKNFLLPDATSFIKSLATTTERIPQSTTRFESLSLETSPPDTSILITQNTETLPTTPFQITSLDTPNPEYRNTNVTTPDSTSPDITTSENLTSESTTPDSTNRDTTTLSNTYPDTTTPNYTTSNTDVTSPDSTSPDITTSDNLTSESTTPDSTNLDTTTPTQTNPDTTTPDTTTPNTPDTTAPNTPDTTTPNTLDTTTLNNTSPDTTTLNYTSPDTTTLNFTSPDTTTLNYTSPDTTTLNYTSPDTITPEYTTSSITIPNTDTTETTETSTSQTSHIPTTPIEPTTDETTGAPTTGTPPLIGTEKDKSSAVLLGILIPVLVIGVSVILWMGYKSGRIIWPPKYLSSDTADNVRPSYVALKKFPAHCDQMLEVPSKLSSEFEFLKTLSDDIIYRESFIAAQMPDNKVKNRYTNILPYDSTRVKLIPEGNDFFSDYINASYIKGYTNEIEYIATQGPKEETSRDFWRMIYQEPVKVIVMVTQFEEMGRPKCHKYFPNLRENMVHGDITIWCTTELHFPIYTSRTLVLTKDDRKRSITHLHFREWPDFGCPSTPDLMLQFCQVMRQHITVAQPGITVVHCSAGVGRTGTLIAVDILLQQINENKKISVFDTVFKLRKHRVSMVQSEAQYVYIYKCIKEALENPSYVASENSSSSSMEPIYENIECSQISPSTKIPAEVINIESEFAF